MSQSFNNTQQRFLARIVQLLENGGHLTDAIVDHIDAVLFSPEPDRLAAFLTDDADSQRDSLLDLIFFPDQAVQVDLEPLLEAARYSDRDEAQLHDQLIARAVHARIDMPDGRHLVSIRLPDFIKSQYLARLNISWKMDPQVAALIGKHLSAATRPIVRVRFRNAGIRTTSGQRDFLCRFFQRIKDSDADFLACLDLVLALLATAGEGVDIYELLVEHKRSLFRSLQQARRFETLLGQSNMETLMLQGVRASHVSPNVLKRHIRLIDLLCLGVFGNTETIELPTEEPIRQVSLLDTDEAAIQSLLR
jgi:hypothetical protein